MLPKTFLLQRKPSQLVRDTIGPNETTIHHESLLQSCQIQSDNKLLYPGSSLPIFYKPSAAFRVLRGDCLSERTIHYLYFINIIQEPITCLSFATLVRGDDTSISSMVELQLGLFHLQGSTNFFRRPLIFRVFGLILKS